MTAAAARPAPARRLAAACAMRALAGACVVEGKDGNNYSPNLDIRLDYGMDVPGRPGLMTPYTEFSLGDRNAYRLGLQWRHSKWFDLKLVGEREEGGTTAEHGIHLEGEIAF